MAGVAAAMHAVPAQHAEQPVITLMMEGFMRVHVPASPELQALFLLSSPDIKNNPPRLDGVQQEADAHAGKAVQIFQQMLARNPMLQAAHGDMGLSYANIGGKLSYVFQIPVRTK
jgi:hypothetical protein